MRNLKWKKFLIKHIKKTKNVGFSVELWSVLARVDKKNTWEETNTNLKKAGIDKIKRIKVLKHPLDILVLVRHALVQNQRYIL